MIIAKHQKSNKYREAEHSKILPSKILNGHTDFLVKIIEMLCVLNCNEINETKFLKIIIFKVDTLIFLLRIIALPRFPKVTKLQRNKLEKFETMGQL